MRGAVSLSRPVWRPCWRDPFSLVALSLTTGAWIDTSTGPLHDPHRLASVLWWAIVPSFSAVAAIMVGVWSFIMEYPQSSGASTGSRIVGRMMRVWVEGIILLSVCIALAVLGSWVVQLWVPRLLTTPQTTAWLGWAVLVCAIIAERRALARTIRGMASHWRVPGLVARLMWFFIRRQDDRLDGLAMDLYQDLHR